MEIEVNSKKHGKHIILIDDEDWELIHLYKWYVKKDNNVFYARAHTTINDKRIDILMHRIILELTNSKIIVDHINHNGLDNRRCNIRICTNKENVRNSRPIRGHKYKGVHYKKGVWSASIECDGKNIFIGVFNSEEDAAKGYNITAKKLFGEFACLNNIDGWEKFDINKNKRKHKYTSEYLGVRYLKCNNRWVAKIRINGNLRCIGYFRTEQEAAMAYNIQAFNIYGDSIELNNIEGWQDFNIENNRCKRMKTSIYRGVSFLQRTNMWTATIHIARKGIYLGQFKTEKEAALTYNKAVIEYGKHRKFLNRVEE